ncbi:nucleotidyltransferase family protein [Streptomyces chiangmaiensis]|uniref:Nucleotidyltransferase family protein n=1 Tax=Streptomyces chiangmaiensis TaxID=766497 RepID=A0ABU7FWW6_9ACTN|nr:nucleotidyltransferase family protein [Streptomyces chiangmaiensis]MED7828617.1 nucleotidyltransferase family protein [Streptomyces chiangmaiensis]
MISRLPLDQQLDSLHAVLSRNDVLTEVLARTATLSLPGWYVAAGCLFQTVWNVVTERPPTSGIKDYDVIYFDDRDLSWEAEDAVIKTGREVFADLPADVEIRNEARVHLWYEDKFGVPCPPFDSSEAAIDSFAATTCCLGVRVETDGRWRVYAPHGLSDMFNLVLRPNPTLAPRSVYETKAARWHEQWPELRVMDWPATSSASIATEGVEQRNTATTRTDPVQ